MQCVRFHDAISALVDGELDAPSERTLRTHLASCPDCTRRLHQLEVVRRRVRVRAATAAPDLTAAVLASVGAEHARTRRRTPRTTPRAVRFMPAATFVLVLSSGIVAGRVESRAIHPIPPAPSQALRPSVCSPGTVGSSRFANGWKAP